MQLGGLSLGALTTGLNPCLSNLWAAEAEANTTLDPEFSVILFWANGGPSHLDLFDLKPEAPAEIRGPFRPIETNVPGLRITELMPQLARVADKLTLIRSFSHERGEHSGGTHRFLSGYPSRAANLQDAEFPELGSVVSRSLSHLPQPVPLFVANTKFYGGGPGYLGSAYAPFMPSPNPLTSTGNNVYDPVPIFRTPNSVDNLSITPEGTLALERRAGLRRALDRLPRGLDQSGTLDAFETFHARAWELLSGGRTRAAFDLDLESAATRERYGRTHLGDSLLTCRRLVEAGVRFVQCQANYRLRPETGETSNWDDHSVNSHIFRAYEEKVPSLDQAMAALIDDLHARGLDRRVLFLFCGEFGRTPVIRNQDPSGRPGRDHWPRAMSVLVAGGGLRMGQVIGATNRKAEEPVERMMDSNCLLATVYHRFGIDPRHSFPDFSGRPIPILPSGTVIPELL